MGLKVKCLALLLMVVVAVVVVVVVVVVVGGGGGGAFLQRWLFFSVPGVCLSSEGHAFVAVEREKAMERVQAGNPQAGIQNTQEKPHCVHI